MSTNHLIPISMIMLENRLDPNSNRQDLLIWGSGGMIAKTSIDHELCSSLLDWYDREKRDLPWRNTRDPWLILLSEVILQQTQVSRGILYWERISERFPTVKSMARSDVDELLLLWQGAGYYSRARRLHALAVIVSTDEAEGGMTESYHASTKSWSSSRE